MLVSIARSPAQGSQMMESSAEGQVLALPRDSAFATTGGGVPLASSNAQAASSTLAMAMESAVYKARVAAAPVGPARAAAACLVL